MRVGERLTEALRVKGLGLREASEQTGVPYRTLQDYTRLQREPKAETIGQIGTRLRVSCDWLLTGEGSMWKAAGLSPDEEWLLRTWGKLNERQRDAWRVLLGHWGETDCTKRADHSIHEDPAGSYASFGTGDGQERE